VSGPQVDYVEYVEGRLAWLRRLAYLLCQDWHEADDLVQATLTRLYTYWPRAAQMDNIDAYVRTILVPGLPRRAALALVPPRAAARIRAG